MKKQEIPLIEQLFIIAENDQHLNVCEDLWGLIRSDPQAYIRTIPRFRRLVLTVLQKMVKARFHKKAAAADDLYKRTFFFMGQYYFEDFLIGMEYDRPQNEQFYKPRQKQLKPVVRELQRLATGELDLLCISLPPGVGKTTLALFFLCWLIGRDYTKPIVGGSYSKSLMVGAYEECKRLIEDETYNYIYIFPHIKIVHTNAQTLTIDINREERFSAFQFTSVGSGNAGRLRAFQLLYCDDLCSGIEEAMSKERLDKLWVQYTSDLLQRKLGSVPELHIATRWSTQDVIGRLENSWGDNDRAKFVVIPALNEDGESNFDYDYEVGFSTANYHALRDMTDDISWRAIYMNQPIEREGLLYSTDELRRYAELPEGEPNAILAICDTKDVGTDYGFMPIVYQYDNDYYIVDCICTNSLIEFKDEVLADKLIQHKVQMIRFESNNSGGKIADNVQKIIQAQQGKTEIKKKYTTGNKETRIVINSPWVKQNCLFLTQELYTPKSHYGVMMNMLVSYALIRKNKNDDVPDGLGMLAEFVESLVGNRVSVFRKPW